MANLRTYVVKLGTIFRRETISGSNSLVRYGRGSRISLTETQARGYGDRVEVDPETIIDVAGDVPMTADDIVQMHWRSVVKAIENVTTIEEVRAILDAELGRKDGGRKSVLQFISDTFVASGEPPLDEALWAGDGSTTTDDDAADADDDDATDTADDDTPTTDDDMPAVDHNHPTDYVSPGTDVGPAVTKGRKPTK